MPAEKARRVRRDGTPMALTAKEFDPLHFLCGVRAKADVAKVRSAEVRSHLWDTYVTWAGGTADDSAFYVRVHSRVVWVEVDGQGPGPLAVDLD
ncbi:DUF3500 domain-containing protein, partial [Streptomyces sp. NRRL B-24085]|uniref:DUF3500 domain-containing protein n=1 Tax=Streptomyces sp. NRRL B-24085 TaxID=1709476 RepID=UPI00211B1404